MLERFKFFAFILFAVLIGGPIMILAHLLLFVVVAFTILDIPIWLLTGKTPVSDLVVKIDEGLR